MIELQNCTFSYSRKRDVLQDFSLGIGGGRTVILGPNGAGKSTLLALMANALEPSSGRVMLDGTCDPHASKHDRAQFRRAVAWLPQQIYPFPSLTVREQVAYMGWLKGLSRSESWARSSSALDTVDLRENSDRPARGLSGGQLRRVGLAGALVHRASVILLDEPTAGLDPSQRNRFRELLLRIPDETAVLVSTHQTEDVHDSYERTVLIDEGVILFDGTIDQFVRGTPQDMDMRDRVFRGYSRLIASEE